MKYSREVTIIKNKRRTTVAVEVSINELRLAEYLAQRAVKNKSRVTTRIDGIIKARIEEDT